MPQIIEENRRPSFAQNFGQAIGGALQGANQFQEMQKSQKMNAQANQMASQLLGFDTSGMEPKTRDQLIMEKFRQEGALNLQENKFKQDAEALTQKTDVENRQKIEPLRGAMDALNRMKSLRKKGNLGLGSSYSPFSSTRKDAGEYEQLGKSLIQYATNIPIRNRIEFETLAERLYDPNITDASAEGILNAMERIINTSLSAYGAQSTQESSTKASVGSKQQNRPPLTQFVGK